MKTKNKWYKVIFKKNGEFYEKTFNTLNLIFLIIISKIKNTYRIVSIKRGVYYE